MATSKDAFYRGYDPATPSIHDKETSQPRSYEECTVLKNYTALLNAVRAGNFEALAQYEYHHPIVWNKINKDWAELRENERPAPEQVRETLLIAIASNHRTLPAHIEIFMRNKPEYSEAISEALKLTILKNNRYRCLEILCDKARPSPEQIQAAKQYATDPTNHCDAIQVLSGIEAAYAKLELLKPEL